MWSHCLTHCNPFDFPRRFLICPTCSLRGVTVAIHKVTVVIRFYLVCKGELQHSDAFMLLRELISNRLSNRSATTSTSEFNNFGTCFVQSEGGFPVGIDREVIPPHRDVQPSKINLSRATEDPPTPHHITLHAAPSTSHTLFFFFCVFVFFSEYVEQFFCLRAGYVFATTPEGRDKEVHLSKGTLTYIDVQIDPGYLPAGVGHPPKLRSPTWSHCLLQRCLD